MKAAGSLHSHRLKLQTPRSSDDMENAQSLHVNTYYTQKGMVKSTDTNPHPSIIIAVSVPPLTSFPIPSRAPR
jgi:hypothetical protein